MSEHPKETGAFLSEKEVEKVAQTMWNRFHYVYGFKLQWNDNNNSMVRKQMVKLVKQVLDSLSINGYKLVKTENKELGKDFLSKASR